jgi:hypothetical protein
MEKKINQWIKRYAKTFYDADFGYADCDMIDSCVYDLGADRDLVTKLVLAFIATA